MLFRNMLEAQKAPVSGCSWITRVYVTVTLNDGRSFVRTYDFDTSRHKCRKCRRALRKHRIQRHRIASTGHVCEVCGNPYAGFVRQGVRKLGPNKFEELRHCWSGSGRLH